jgi:predicted glycoside hydrolase/deacetylase ChbG (UPF0249 family)
MSEQIKRNNLIISADDFGKSDLANRNILCLAEAGKLDRVSVMSNGNFGSGEIQRIVNSGVKLDIHFELVWQKRRRNLLRDKTLRQGIVFFVNYSWGDWPVPKNPRSGVRAVKQEWQGQIKKFREIFGRLPDGISSHEHTHYFPPYFRIALYLARRFDIHFIRFGKKGFLGKRNAVKFILNVMRWIDKRKFMKSNISSSEYFASFDWFNSMNELQTIISEKKVELACHPERKEEMDLINKYF